MRLSSALLCLPFVAMPADVGAQTGSRTLVAVFAHPDDERIVGPLLARYAREGHEVHLVVATDGSKGVREHAGVPAGDSLARVRADETRCAARELGIHPPILLGLEDAGLASFASLDRLRADVRRVLGELHPDAVISFGPEGGTGHPDHRLVGIVVTEVVQTGGSGIPEALFYASLPAERMKDAPPAQPNVTSIPERFLPIAVPFEPGDLEAGRRAFACHRTQYTAAGDGRHHAVPRPRLRRGRALAPLVPGDGQPSGPFQAVAGRLRPGCLDRAWPDGRGLDDLRANERLTRWLREAARGILEAPAVFCRPTGEQ